MEELTGPLTGVVMPPERLDWSERAAFHLDVPAERNLMYERVIREATRAGDLREYLMARCSAKSGRVCSFPPGTGACGKSASPA